MSKNVIHTDDGKTMVFNGGDPLPGCPDSWDEAHIWEKNSNADACFGAPEWKFDCGFKLDFDGELMSVRSRFYPPKSHYGPKWDGELLISMLGKPVVSKKFEEDSLYMLRLNVERFLNDFVSAIFTLIKREGPIFLSKHETIK